MRPPRRFAPLAARLRRPGKPRHPERDLQAALVSFFRAAVTPGDALLFAIPNGEKRDETTAAMLSGISQAERERLAEVDWQLALMPYGQGVLPGAFDLVLVTAPATDWLEVKVPAVPALGQRAGVLSAPQKRLHRAMERFGRPVSIIRCETDLADLLERRGVALRCRPWGPGISDPRPPARLRPAPREAV